MATLRAKGGRYFVDYRVNGRRVRRAIGKSKKVAELALKDIEVKIERQEIGFVEKDIELNKLFEEFASYSNTHHAPSSQNRYRAIIDNFKRFLSGSPYIKKISQLTPKFIEDYQAHRKGQGAANKTVNVELICLHSMFTLAVKWGYARHNTAQGVKPLKEESNKKPRFLSKEECKVLLENAGDFFYPILYAFLHTGMRKSELENLTWADVDLERKKIKIRYKDDWSPKTSEREIPISGGLYDLLIKRKDHVKGRGCPYVYNRCNMKLDPNYLRKKLMSLTERCGFPDVTKIHSLRHTFASHLIMGGVDLPTVKKLLGHANIETTMVYSHLADEHVDKAVDKLNF
ncbi:MAG: site-specific integrase [Candidatus Omnitrophica bacterium]|nr:site-specific integrase [Candidatus Omnitrophota bacterium]